MSKEEIKTEELLEVLEETNPEYKEDVLAIEKRFNCCITSNTEKHSALQYTHYYEIDFGLEENFFVEIESGISNGSQINNESWGYDSTPKSRTIEVLKDIVLDADFYDSGSLLERKAQAVLDRDKQLIFDHIRRDSYDNYVTGGHSKVKAKGLWTELYLDYIYEEKEVDCNFI